MRIVIDMQSAQGENKNRGIGKYTVAFTKAIINQSNNNEIILLFNGFYKNSISSINSQLIDCSNKYKKLIWYPIEKNFHNINDNWSNTASKIILEEFVNSLNPDIFLISTALEDFDANGIIANNFKDSNITTAILFYDLISLIYEDNYSNNIKFKEWYCKNLYLTKEIDIHLCISENTENSSTQYLTSDSKKIFNISGCVKPVFKIKSIKKEEEALIREKFGLDKPFLVCTGGMNFKKNISNFIIAFSNLSLNIKNNFQVIIVSNELPEEKDELTSLALSKGLKTTQIIFKSCVSESDLITLYNLCKAFVFPSFDEGLGLPILEALSCGCVVIAPNSLCMPDVLGNNETLFDPIDENSFTNKLEYVLTNSEFNRNLQLHAAEQSKKFNWNVIAQLVLKNFTNIKSQNFLNITRKNNNTRKKLAYLSPLAPDKSGISDYSVELLPELSVFYDIDIIINQTEVSDLRIKQNYAICSINWFIENASSYDRIIYHIGNSGYHKHMFDLCKLIPGIVVLHDFYISSILHYLDYCKINENIWFEALYNSHGYVALRNEYKEINKKNNWPCNYFIIQNAIGIIAHSNYLINLTKTFYKETIPGHCTKIPLLRNTAITSTKDKKFAREKLKINNDDFVVCSFGFLSPHKLNQQLIDSWIISNLAQQANCLLVFVGEAFNNEYIENLTSKINNLHIKSRIVITGWVDKELYKDYLTAADVGVQLRGISTGETSAAVLDCMNYGLATIVNRNGTMDELVDNTVFKIADNFTTEELKDALETIYQNSDVRENLKNNAQKFVHSIHNPQNCAFEYFQFIEKSYNDNLINIPKILKNIADRFGNNLTQDQLKALSFALDNSFVPKFNQEQILLDITHLSELQLHDESNNLLKKLFLEIILNPPVGYRVEPVIKDAYSNNYYYARSLVLKLLDISLPCLEDAFVNISETDIFVKFDLQ